MSSSSTAKNLHVPLPADTYEALRSEAERESKPATAVARQAIEAWLKRKKRSEIYGRVLQYASQFAGTKADLDPELEAAAIDHLKKS